MSSKTLDDMIALFMQKAMDEKVRVLSEITNDKEM